VSWNDAVAYTEWLSEQTGQNYRLSSEAEWEYGARAGSESKYYWGNDADEACSYANVVDKTTKEKHSGWTIHNCTDGYVEIAPVGKFKANGFGLNDMTGNVWEWCADGWHDNYNGAPSDGSVWENNSNNYRVLRGGSWGMGPYYTRSAERNSNSQAFTNHAFGIRIVRTLAP